MNTKVLGTKGETLAEKYLQKKGYKILQKNYKNFIGEIDIICFDKKNNETIFVEVKTRQSAKYGQPCEAVNYFKQQKIYKTATVYLKQKSLLDEKFRFDVIEILGDDINHIEYAFWLKQKSYKIITKSIFNSF